MKTCIRVLIVVLSMIMLSSCLSPVKVKPESTYLLNSVPPVAKKRTRPVTILVLQPVTDPAYNTTQMVYSLNPYQIAYYDKNHWAETPGQMLQPLIVKTLQNTHHFHAVVTPPTISRYNYILDTQILQLKQDYTHQPASVRLSVRAQLIRASTNQVVATKEFNIVMPMHQYTPYGGVVAANAAVRELLEDLAHFCSKNIH